MNKIALLLLILLMSAKVCLAAKSSKEPRIRRVNQTCNQVDLVCDSGMECACRCRQDVCHRRSCNRCVYPKDSGGSGSSSRNQQLDCADLNLFPVGSVDPADQYRFDYSDVGFGTAHKSGATVTVTCTQNSVLGITYALNRNRAVVRRGISVVATCETGVGWTIAGEAVQFFDCRLQ